LYFICCKILNVLPGADAEDIKIAYRKLAKELHPDINHSVKAQEYFVIMKNAYHYLLEHTYTKEEAEILFNAKHKKEQIAKIKFEQAIRFHPNPYSSKTLREILISSALARSIYYLFHLLFISVGIFLVFKPVYNIFYYNADPRTNTFSAYLSVVFGFLFGIILTTCFLYTGIKYMRRR
jgi:hypothetical protein